MAKTIKATVIDIPESEIKEGDIIKGSFQPQIYLFENGVKRWIPDMVTLLSKWKSEAIVAHNQNQVNLIPVGTDYPTVRLVFGPNSDDMWVIQNGLKRLIDEPTLLSIWPGNMLIGIPQNEIDSIPRGQDYPSIIIHYNVSYGQLIKLKHNQTNWALHSHTWNYFHPRSSAQQQVTCAGGNDDNDLWKFKSWYGNPEDFNNGKPIFDGDTVRLEHVLTGRNLHSHAGFPSPLTKQQEVTCYEVKESGDNNDNFHLEIEGGGYLDIGKKFRLVHVPTAYALHSHNILDNSREMWIKGQQEVTCYNGRDNNDFWEIAPPGWKPKQPQQQIPIDPPRTDLRIDIRYTKDRTWQIEMTAFKTNLLVYKCIGTAITVRHLENDSWVERPVQSIKITNIYEGILPTLTPSAASRICQESNKSNCDCRLWAVGIGISVEASSAGYPDWNTSKPSAASLEVRSVKGTGIVIINGEVVNVGVVEIK